MNRQDLDLKMEGMAKVLLSYCAARTSNHFDAEDLAHDIIGEIYQSAKSIRNPDAIYGFMWAVAGNVYKQWCKRKAKEHRSELTDQFGDMITPAAEDDSALHLLRRELSLLSCKYRQAVILYYIENKSCSQIAKHLSVSESMVKYLLFKSRQILKEGMNMERNYGQQSYNPKGLSLLFWGNGANRYYHLCDSKISQNILFACYNDKLSAEQISLEIGVALPYMEDKLAELCEYDLLKKDGRRYYTNIVIFTKDFASEVASKTIRLKDQIADRLVSAITTHEGAVRKIGFAGADMGHNTFAWQMACIILYHAVIEILQKKIHIAYPRDKFGAECFVWGAEHGENTLWKSGFEFGISNAMNHNGDYVQFMDFRINGDMVHHYGFDKQHLANVFLDVAKGNTDHFSENDRAVAADLIRKGYICSNGKKVWVNAPVLTRKQYDALKTIFDETANQIAAETEILMVTVADILKNHVPVHLKNHARAMAYLRLFEDAISAPIALLYERNFLQPYDGSGLLPTTYVILK